jgi:hypothetical protein
MTDRSTARGDMPTRCANALTHSLSWRVSILELAAVRVTAYVRVVLGTDRMMVAEVIVMSPVTVRVLR